MINWHALGLTDQQIKKVPGPRDFPPALNRSASRYWPEALKLVSDTDPKKAWESALKRFVTICGRHNIYPYDNRSANNDQIYTELIRARRLVVRFIEKSELNTTMIVRTTERRVKATNTGFLLRCVGHCDTLPEPPAVLQSLGLRSTSSEWAAVWSTDLGQNVRFFVANDGANMSGRWHYGYEVTIPIFPYVPGLGAPSSSAIEKFVLDIIYLPILRAYRPIGLMHRLV